MSDFINPGCDPFTDPTCIDQPPPIVTIVLDTGVAAEVGSVAALAGATASAVEVIKSVAGLILRALTTVLSLAALIWTTVLKPLLAALKKVLDALKHITDKILRPYLDWMRQMRKIILDLYNRFVRPLIVILESLRHIIHFFQLLHIHIFDQLDRTLAKIEGKLLTPIYFALYRLNTLGNWVSFILNGFMLIHRGLFLGSMNASRGGSFSLLANAPIYGFVELPHVDTTQVSGTAIPDAVLIQSFSSAIGGVSTRVGSSPVGDLLNCWKASFTVDMTAGGPVADVIKCWKQSLGIQTGP